MIRLISLVAILMFIGACASTGPEATADTASSERQSAPVIEVSEGVANAKDPNEVICRSERQTGSRFATRVCRTRAEIEARSAKDQSALGDSRASQSGSDCMLNGNC